MNEDEEKPLDIAVALNYEKESDNAPKVIAKGYGEVAKRIVETAKENDIIIETNEMLAEALSNVELDETIPIELYEAVAEIIGFVLRANEKIS
ncbi:MAG: EscU/YscU/HrcU family type III secretion system export apparatus switch protein [Devosiaceae bacterium]|nr:EscU/YscU/HrcU family type III secretion system export apparatus switch protein [Devosiaceae bacterium]